MHFDIIEFIDKLCPKLCHQMNKVLIICCRFHLPWFNGFLTEAMKNNIITLIPKITNKLVQFTGNDMINSDEVYSQVLCVMYMVFYTK